METEKCRWSCMVSSTANSGKLIGIPRQQALSAGLYNYDNYFKGIPCGCIETVGGYRAYIRKHFDLDQEQLTFTSIFCNAMYAKTQKHLLPIAQTYDIVLVSNEKTNLQHLKKQGLNLIEHIPIPENAWKNHQNILEKLCTYLQNSQPKDKLFLFSAGPLSNILIHQLFKKYPNNTYIDIDSCMDNQHGLKVSDRAYLRWDSWKHLARCYWNHKTNPDSISCDTHGKSKLQRQLIRLKALYQRLKQHLPFAISQRKITALKPNTAHKNSNQKQIMLVLAL